jgi:hypothetical protein
MMTQIRSRPHRASKQQHRAGGSQRHQNRCDAFPADFAPHADDAFDLDDRAFG